MNDKIKILYDTVSKEYDMGTLEEFTTKLQSPEKRQVLFDMVGDKYNLGTFEEFETKVVKKKGISGNGISNLGTGISGRPKPTIEEFDPSNPAFTRLASGFSAEIQTAAEVAQKLSFAKKTDPYDEYLKQLDTIKFNKQEESKELKKYLAKTPSPKELTFMDRVKEIGDDPTQLLPFFSGAKETTELMKLMESANRLDQDIATDKDLLLLKQFVDKAGKETTFWYDVMNVVAELPSFAGELFTTGGIYTAVKKATVKGSTTLLKKMLTEGGKELLEKKLLKISVKEIGGVAVKAIGGVAGATAKAVPAGITKITAGTVRNMMPEISLSEDEEKQITGSITKEGDEVLSAATKALGSQWIETLSERSGGLFNSVGKAGKEVMIRHGLLKSFLKANPKATVSDFMTNVKRAGYDGIVSEMLEERAGEIGRAAIGLEDYKLPTPRQLLTELVAFSIPGLTIAGINKATQKAQTKEGLKKVEEEIEKVMPLTEAEKEEKKAVDELKPEKLEETPSEILEAELQEFTKTDKDFIALQEEATKATFNIQKLEKEKLSLFKKGENTSEIDKQIEDLKVKGNEAFDKSLKLLEDKKKELGQKLTEKPTEQPITKTTYDFETARPEMQEKFEYFTKEIEGKTEYFKKEKEISPKGEAAPIAEKSILNQDVDLKGKEKDTWMQEAAFPKDDLYIGKALKENKYQQAISEGRMTANDAKIIIESAELEVPKDILELAEKEKVPPKPIEPAEEFIPEREPEPSEITAKTFPEYETKDKKYTVSKTSKTYITGKGKREKRFNLEVLNNTTGKIVAPTSIGGKRAIEEYKERILPILQRGKEAELSEGMGEEQARQEIAQKSENPAEVAREWISEAEKKEVGSIEDAIYTYLPKITAESFARYGDPNFITPSIRLKYFASKAKGGMGIDQAAPIIKEAMGKVKKGEEGVEMTAIEESEIIDTIIDFITEHPGGKETFDPRSQLEKRLAEKFHELTGFEIDKEYAEKILKYKPEEFISERAITPEEELTKIKEKREKLKAERGEYFSNFMSSLGLKSEIIGEKRPDVIKALQGIAETYAKELGLRGQELLIRLKNEIKKLVKDFDLSFIDQNQDEILGKYKDKLTSKEREKLRKEKETEERLLKIKQQAEKGQQELNEMAKKFEAESDKQIKEKNKTTLSKILTMLDRGLFDKRAQAKKYLRDIKATEVIAKKNRTLHASAYVKQQFIDARDKIFGRAFKKTRLDKEEKALLNHIIQYRRVIELDNYKDKLKDELKELRENPEKNKERITEIEKRGTTRLKHTKLIIEGKEVFLSKELAEARLKSLEQTPDFKKLNERADTYFNTNKKLLQERLDAGLIDENQLERLSNLDYSKRIFVERMMDFETLEKSGSYTSGEIKALKEGSEDLLFNNAEYLLEQNIATTTRSIFENDANKTLYNFVEKNPDITKANFKLQKPTGVNRETGQPSYPDPPAGWQQVHHKENGIRKSMLVRSDFAAGWQGKDPLITQSAANVIQWVTGKKPLQFFATGVNPLFALWNFPRDLGFTYYFTDTYSPHLPIALKEMGADLMTVAKDVFLRKGRMREYIAEGGGMDYLTNQGQVLTKGAKTDVGQAAETIQDIAGYVGSTSEYMTRLAIREREIAKQTKDFIEKNNRVPTPAEEKEIKIIATSRAVDMMDFSQGGEWVKAADNFAPYLNASFQALRVSSRAFKERPISTSYKVAQGMAAVTGIVLYNLQWDDDDEKNGVLGRKAIPPYINATGQPIMMPYTTTNKQGQTVRPYVFIPIPQEFSPFKNVAQSLTEWAVTGNFNGELITKSLEVALPFSPISPAEDVPTPPIVEALIAYQANYDRFRQKEAWMGEEAGVAEYTPYTDKMFVDFGKVTGMSPERSKVAYGKVFTAHESNIYSQMLSAGYNGVRDAFTDEQKKEFDNMTSRGIEKILTPAQRRFYKYPSSRGAEEKIIKDRQLEENARKQIEEKNKVIESAIAWREAQTPQEKEKIEKELSGYAKNLEKTAEGAEKRINDAFNRTKKRATINNSFIINLIYERTPEVRARAFYDVWKDSKNQDELEITARDAGLTTDRFINEFKRLSGKQLPGNKKHFKYYFN